MPRLDQYLGTNTDIHPGTVIASKLLETSCQVPLFELPEIAQL